MRGYSDDGYSDLEIYINRSKARKTLKEVGFDFQIDDAIGILEFFRDEERVMEVVRRLKLEAFE